VVLQNKLVQGLGILIPLFGGLDPYTPNAIHVVSPPIPRAHATIFRLL